MSAAPDAGAACPLCGARAACETACSGCPLAGGCELVRCGHCGYQYPRTSRIVTWWARCFGLEAGAQDR
jgi:hypothetical protein